MSTIVKSGGIAFHTVIAAFDLGSNSVKMTVARAGDAPGEIDEFMWRSETVRLGAGVDQTGQLAPDRVEAALDALRRFAADARAAGATRLIGVATEATRIASNGQAFLDQVTSELGIELQAISGDREAALTFLGLDGVVELHGEVVVADIGGGSTEIIIACDKAVAWSRSFALGSGRMTDLHVTTDPPTASELAAVRRNATEILAGAPLAGSAGGRLIVIGGTGECMARLLTPGATPDGSEIDAILDRLTAIPAGDLANMLTIAESRARVLPAGIAIARAVADGMSPAAIESAQSGIRRGLLLDAFAESGA